MPNEFDINKNARKLFCPFQQGNVTCCGTSCAVFVLGETDGHCAFQILPQLVTELREINNRPIPFSEEPLEAAQTSKPWDTKEPWDED